MGGMIISARKGSKAYHEPFCPCVKNIQPKNLKMIDVDKAVKRGYSECSICGGLHGVFMRTKLRPTMFGEKHRKSVKFSFDYKDKALCLRTANGFWKVIQGNMDGYYRLYHLNHECFDVEKTDLQLMRLDFHRQVDLQKTTQLGKIVNYVVSHDKAQVIKDKNWRDLPKRTQKQRRYYRQAARKEKRKANRRIDKLFEQIEKEGKTRYGKEQN